jgi:hypothetical protein
MDGRAVAALFALLCLYISKLSRGKNKSENEKKSPRKSGEMKRLSPGTQPETESVFKRRRRRRRRRRVTQDGVHQSMIFSARRRMDWNNSFQRFL